MDANKVRIERVLCAVTFSPSADHVVAWSAWLAGANDAGGEVRLFHALPNADPYTSPTSEANSERVLRKLFALARRLPGRPRVSASVAEGEAVNEIVRHARLTNADVIAIGMHARDGSVSPLITRLAIDAPCPILVVDERSAAPSPRDVVDRVLVAVDFRPASLAAADYAVALAQAFRADVTLVHVLSEHWQGPERHDQNLDEMRHFLEQHFRRLLRIAARGPSGSNRDRTEVVVSGRPCVEIVRVAASQSAHLIVMGIDKGANSANTFGETTSCTVQFAGRTVLLVPERLFRTPRVSRSVRSH